MEVVGSNLRTVYWMDIIQHLFVLKIEWFVLKDEINEKEAGDGPFLKLLARVIVP